LEYLPRLEENFKQSIRENTFNNTGFLPKVEVYEYLSRRIRIRNELFEEIVFPVLWKGYKNKDIQSMIWLTRLNQNYYQNNRIRKLMDYKSPIQIIQECYEIDPNNHEVSDLYLEFKIDGISYSIHEFPSAILTVNDDTRKEDCKKLLEEIPFLNALDKNKKYIGFIKDYEDKIKEYMER
jgi:hypothetical protein